MSRFTKESFAVLNLSWTCLKGDLRTHFAKYGAVRSVQIPMDTKNGFNKGYGFVHIRGPEGFKDKILEDYHTIDHREVRVEPRSMKNKIDARETPTPSETSE